MGPPPKTRVKKELFLYVWEQTHKSCTLHGCLYGALLTSGKLCATTAHHATMRIDELLQEIDIFVIEMLYVILS